MSGLKRKKRYSIFYAWILLLVFMLAHICKDLDLHLSLQHVPHLKTIKSDVKAQVKAYCPTCNFTWQKSESAKSVTFIPILIGILISHYEIKELTVWRPIYSVNANSPPSFLLV
ncbi:hypothetical protein HMPREF3202_02126 [Prevotella bivia]|uniref:Uncharacterized protein n=2 Tax=Prevotella bivia TaxID=28125 RepID=I4ZA31_9BACT|nr:hypothetical protein PrebiDRAFT_1364 [Prevotella bivia DSM 20514]KXO15031.1 hypothetical protein HMPREF3202_02126 [Prevotella bivia]